MIRPPRQCMLPVHIATANLPDHLPAHPQGQPSCFGNSYPPPLVRGTALPFFVVVSLNSSPLPLGGGLSRNSPPPTSTLLDRKSVWVCGRRKHKKPQLIGLEFGPLWCRAETPRHERAQNTSGVNDSMCSVRCKLTSVRVASSPSSLSAHARIPPEWSIRCFNPI